MGTKRIPFDFARINEDNIKVVTRDGRNARILCTDLKGDKKIAAAVTSASGEYEYICEYYTGGRYYKKDESDADLFLEVLVKPRRMTNRELAWWLRDKPEEHREWKYNGSSSVNCGYNYLDDHANDECEDVLIRRNGGKWHEPLIEEE